MDNNAKKDKKSTKNNNKSQLKYLDVKLGDHVMNKNTKRLGCVHKIPYFGKKNFLVTWLDNGQMTGFLSKKTQQDLVKTGYNIYDSDSDSD